MKRTFTLMLMKRTFSVMQMKIINSAVPMKIFHSMVYMKKVVSVVLMKNIFSVVFILVILLAMTSCWTDLASNAEKQSEHQPVVTPLAPSPVPGQNPLLPVVITEGSADLNRDSHMEVIKVVMLQGESTGGNLYQGTFAVEVYEGTNLLDSVALHDNITLLSGFTLLFKDYNGDGILDFNIGHSDPKESQNYIYHFFTVDEGMKLQVLQAGLVIHPGVESTLRSCQKGHSFNFRSIGNNSFTTYGYDGEQYEYRVYQWMEERFVVTNYLHSPLSYADVDEAAIQEKINTIYATVSGSDEKEILIYCEDEYNWLLNHSEQVALYLLMNNDAVPGNNNLDRLLSARIYEENQVNFQFADTFGTDRLDSYTLEEIKRLKSNYREDDYTYTEYDWRVDETQYKILTGNFHLDGFVLLFSADGHYLDGYVWTEKRGVPVKTDFYPIQSCFTVSPVNMGYGTGTSHYGLLWLEVYKGKLISRYQIPMEGYDAPPPALGYNTEYRLLEESYDSVTGDYTVTYEVGIRLYQINKLLSIQKQLAFRWKQEHAGFEPPCSDNIVENICTYLFPSGIEDEILEQNADTLETLFSEEADNLSQDDLEQLITFLSLCSGEKKNKLLDTANRLKRESLVENPVSL